MRQHQIRRPNGEGHRDVMNYSRFLMEQKEERKLENWEYVHHIDGNKLNDDIDNLEIASITEHRMLHGNYGGGPHPRKIPPDLDQAWCCSCQKFLNKSEFYPCLYHWNGLSRRCKECEKEYKRRQYANRKSETGRGRRSQEPQTNTYR